MDIYQAMGEIQGRPAPSPYALQARHRSLNPSPTQAECSTGVPPAPTFSAEVDSSFRRTNEFHWPSCLASDRLAAPAVFAGFWLIDVVTAVFTFAAGDLPDVDCRARTGPLAGDVGNADFLTTAAVGVPRGFLFAWAAVLLATAGAFCAGALTNNSSPDGTYFNFGIWVKTLQRQTCGKLAYSVLLYR